METPEASTKKAPKKKSGTEPKPLPKWSTAALLQRREQARAKKDLVEKQEIAGMQQRAIAAYTGNKLGRRTTYTREQGQDLCAWIAAGNSLRSWCVKSGVGLSVVYQWMNAQRELQESYAEACEHRADSLADELTDIADAPAPEDGLSIEEVQLRRLRIDTRKWVAARLRPTRWGDAAPTSTAGSITIQIGIPPRDAALPAVEVVDAVPPTAVELSR